MKSFKEIKASLIKEAKDRIVEKSTWVGILTKVASVVGISLVGVPVEYIAFVVSSYIGGVLTAAHTKEAK